MANRRNKISKAVINPSENAVSPNDNAELPDNNMKSEGQKFSTFAKHPLTLVIITAVLIPFIIFLYNSYNFINEDRQKKTLEIMEKDNNIEKEFSSLYFELVAFQQSNTKKYPDVPLSDEQRGELKKSQFVFDSDFSKKWVEHTKSYSTDHLWVDDLYAEYSLEDVRKLKSFSKDEIPSGVPNNLLKIRQDIESYRNNFSKTEGVIGDLKIELTSNQYTPNDRNLKEKLGGVSSITSRFNDLNKERKEIAENIIQDSRQKKWFEKLICRFGLC